MEGCVVSISRAERVKGEGMEVVRLLPRILDPHEPLSAPQRCHR